MYCISSHPEVDRTSNVKVLKPHQDGMDFENAIFYRLQGYIIWNRSTDYSITKNIFIL